MKFLLYLLERVCWSSILSILAWFHTEDCDFVYPPDDQFGMKMYYFYLSCHDTLL